MTIAETKDVVRREVASPTYGVGESISLLGPVGGGLRLKVSREKPPSFDIVELASRRCLVGSAASCHVRLDESGVAPIECLIIHGAQNNVVRWLARSRELAGGELFEDEVLYPGDPLQIGPVEVELLVDELMSADEPPHAEETPESGENRLAEYILRLERLETQLDELQQASESTASWSGAMNPANRTFKDEVADTISGLAAQLAALQTRSASDSELWAGERAELEALLQSRLREFDVWQDEVERLRDELATVRTEFGNRAENDVTSERLAEVSYELAERTAGFEQQQTAWERDRNEFQRQLRQNIERIEQFEAQLAQESERQAKAEAARLAAEERADRLQESVEELSKRLAEQQHDYEAVRAAWEADRTSLESELAETKQRLAQSAAAESAALELRETWDHERAELKSQIAEAVSRAEEIREELEAQRQLLEEQQRSGREPRAEDLLADQPHQANEPRIDREVSEAPHNPMDRLLAGSSLADDRGDDPDGRLRDFLALKPSAGDNGEAENPDDTNSASQYGCAVDVASNYCEQAFSGSPTAAHLDDAPAEEDTEEDTFENPLGSATGIGGYGDPFEEAELVIDEGEEVAFEMTPAAPPVSTADVLARLGQSVAWSDDDDEVVADVSSDEQPLYQSSSKTPFAPSAPVDASDSEDDEESIEAYMARLMNRVRGTDDREEPSRPVQPTIERTPVTEYTEVTTAPRPAREVETEVFDPEEYKPRSQAPELADRMTAMRSLANDSARTAIASHAKRNWSSVMKLKLFVSGFAFVSVLASIIFFWGDPLLMGLGSLVGFGVLAYWAHTAISYRKLLLESLMLEPEGGSCDEPAAGDVA